MRPVSYVGHLGPALIVALLGCAPQTSGPLAPGSLPPGAGEALALAAVTPSVWPTSGGVRATLLGQGFTADAQLFLDGIAVTPITVLSSTQLGFTIPPRQGLWGSVPLQVKNPTGDSVTRSDLFTYTASELNLGVPSQASYPLSFGPVLSVVGDFNGDRLPDLAFAAELAVEVLPNTGGGRFGAVKLTSVGKNSSCAAAGDVNGDGKLDLVVGYSLGAGLLLGDGQGGFAALVDLRLGYEPSALAVADLNQDGNPDLIAGTVTGANALLGDGTGRFTYTATVGPGTASCGATAVADVNGDARLDVIVGCNGIGGSTIYAGLGDGTGHFLTLQSAGTGLNSSTVAVGDVNADTHPDVVTTDHENGTVGVLLGDGTGRFGAGQSQPVCSYPGAPVLGDFTGDGRTDIAVSCASLVTILRGDDTGRFVSQRGYAPGDKQALTALVAHDLDGDGNLDLAAIDPVAFTIEVMLRTAHGFGATPGLSLSYPAHATIMDANGDQLPDLAVNVDDGLAVLILNAGGGWFQTPRALSTSGEIWAALDVNGDGKQDLVISNGDFYTVGISLGDGAGNFNFVAAFSPGGQPRAAALSDLDGDGRTDLAVLSESFTQSAPSFVVVAIGDGTGRFSQPRQYLCPAGGDQSAAGGMVIADVNNDGKRDVVASCDGNLVVFLSDGAGGLLTPFRGPALSGPLLAADLNQDGFPDLINGGSNSAQSVTLLGDGTGHFVASRAIASTSTTSALAVGNFNGDRWPDVVADKLSSVDLLLGDGTGGLVPGASCPLPLGVNSVSVGDLDGDGKADVAATSQSGVFFCINGSR